MMTEFSNRIATYILKKHLIIHSQYEDFRFGIEVILSQLLTFFPMFIYMVTASLYLKSILFALTFISIRTIKKGFHAKSFLNCFILSNMAYLFCVNSNYIIQTYQEKYTILIPIIYFSYCVILNIGIKDNESLKNLILVLFLGIVIILLKMTGFIELALLIASILLVDMITYVIFNTKAK